MITIGEEVRFDNTLGGVKGLGLMRKAWDDSEKG